LPSGEGRVTVLASRPPILFGTRFAMSGFPRVSQAIISRHTLLARSGFVAHTSSVASPKRPDIQEKDLQGFKLFKLLMPVLEKLHHHGCARDKAGNRKLHYDQYAALILLYFFNPIVTSLRGIVQASGLKKVQRM